MTRYEIDKECSLALQKKSPLPYKILEIQFNLIAEFIFFFFPFNSNMKSENGSNKF